MASWSWCLFLCPDKNNKEIQAGIWTLAGKSSWFFNKWSFRSCCKFCQKEDLTHSVVVFVFFLSAVRKTKTLSIICHKNLWCLWLISQWWQKEDYNIFFHLTYFHKLFFSFFSFFSVFFFFFFFSFYLGSINSAMIHSKSVDLTDTRVFTWNLIYL